MMKKRHFLETVLAAGALLLPVGASALSPEEWLEGLSDLPPSEVLNLIVEDGSGWPKLDALSKTDAAQREDASQLVKQVLEALKVEAGLIADDRSQESLTGRTRRAMGVAKVAKGAGGYLNDLISASGEHAAIIGAWVALDRWRESAPAIKKAVYRDGEKEPLWAKAWFTERVELDHWLSEREERLEKVKEDTPGFQAGNHLGYQRPYPDNVKPTVFELIDAPDLNVLWWKTFLNDFNLAAVLPAACDYLVGGGVLSPAPKHPPKAVAAVFGDEGIPYRHQLRGEGRFRSGDIWNSRDSAVEERSRELNLRLWFGG